MDVWLQGNSSFCNDLELTNLHYSFNYFICLCISVYAYAPQRFSYFLQGQQCITNYAFLGASLVAQWLRIRLTMQGTRVWALVREEPTCHEATKPVCHNYWPCALEPTSHTYWARMPQLLKPVLHNKRSHCKEKAAYHNKEYPLLAATRESPCAATKTQRRQK